MTDNILKQLIDHDFKDALKTKNQAVVSALRLFKAAMLNQEKEGREVHEDDIVNLLRGHIKKINDSIESYRAANREDLAVKEEQELEIIKKYLPPQLSLEEVENKAKKIISRLSAEEQRNFGKIMGLVMAELKGNVDGGVVSRVVKSLVG